MSRVEWCCVGQHNAEPTVRLFSGLPDAYICGPCAARIAQHLGATAALEVDEARITAVLPAIIAVKPTPKPQTWRKHALIATGQG